jgi:hypothetical protein
VGLELRGFSPTFNFTHEIRDSADGKIHSADGKIYSASGKSHFVGEKSVFASVYSQFLASSLHQDAQAPLYFR